MATNTCFGLHIKPLQFGEAVLNPRRLVSEKALDALLSPRLPIDPLIFFRIQIMLCENEVAVGLARRLIQSGLAGQGPPLLRLFLEPFLLYFFKPRDVIFLDGLLLFISENDIGQVWPIDINWLFPVLG